MLNNMLNFEVQQENLDEKQCNKKIKGIQLQICLTLIVGSLIVSESLSAGWTAHIIDHLVDNSANSTNHMSLGHASLIGTLPVYASLFPILILIYSAEKIGRKWTLMWGSFFIFIHWILLYIASTTNFALIYVGICCRGVGTTVVRSLTHIYVAEIAQPNIRGRLCTLFSVFMNTGFLLSFIGLTFISPRQLSIIGAVIVVVFLSLFIKAPKSPYFLMIKDDKDAATKSLQLLRDTVDIQKELNDIQVTIDENHLNQVNILDLVRNKKNRKAFFLIILLITFQQLTGIDNVMLFLEVMLDASNVYFSKNISSIIVISAKLLSCICALVLMDKLGRRPLLIFSAISTTLSLISLGFYFYIKDIIKVDCSSFTWLSLVLLILFILSYTIGFGSVVYVFAAEVLPNRFRAIGSQIATVTFDIMFVINTQIFAWFKDNYGFHLAFWFLAICMCFGTVFVVVSIFETKGKSLKEIQDEL